MFKSSATERAVVDPIQDQTNNVASSVGSFQTLFSKRNNSKKPSYQLRDRTSWARVVLHSVHAWLVVVSKRPNQRSRSLFELAQGMCIHTSF